MKLPHYTNGVQATRVNLRRANRLTEKGCPDYDGSAESIHAIINWLDVEKSVRYKRNATQTFCNIYAYDYADKLGAYLPRVWWDGEARLRAEAGEDVPVIYPANGVKGTILEMNANALYDWFRLRSGNLGWCKIDSKTEAQSLANKGKCVILVGAHVDRGRSGHITAIVPETATYKATGAKGLSDVRTVTAPLQSQAGSVNFKYRAVNWQKNHEPLIMYYWKK
jgi:hypothetical protein